VPVISFEHVSKKFRIRHDRPRSFQELFLNALRLRGSGRSEDFWSLRDITFDVDAGEAVGIVGPNGAGKSTTLKLISRIISPTSGRVTVKGKVTGLLELGAGFHPDLTGRENVYLYGAIMGINRKQVEERLDDIVAFAELEQFIDVPVKHYSSGMYMRLGFSTAVHSDVDVLLVDEVLAVGDQAFQAKCFARARELHEQGVTILFVSHDLDAVIRLCSRAIWLDKGQVRSVGAADDVIADYLDQVRQDRNVQGYQEPESLERRWGSGEAIITDVIFMGEDGSERRIFRTGEPFLARIFYQAHEQVERPTFGVAIYRGDGAHVNGPNSFTDGYHISAIEGRGQMDYVIEALPLLSGRYEFTAAIYDCLSIHPYDHRHRAFTFEVQPGPMGAREGIVHIPSVWEHRAGR
jgi:lipopolysaccharide transport system ATP-binding protein